MASQRRNTRPARYGSYSTNTDSQGLQSAGSDSSMLGIYGSSKAPTGAYRTEQTYGNGTVHATARTPAEPRSVQGIAPSNAPRTRNSAEMPYIDRRNQPTVRQAGPAQPSRPVQSQQIQQATRPTRNHRGAEPLPPQRQPIHTPADSFEGVATILDSGAMNSEMYTIFAEYFSNPTLVKVKADSQTGNSVYYAHIRSQTRSGYRYLIVITEPSEYPLGSQMRMVDLEWLSLQTREVPEPIPNVPTVMYDIPRSSPLAALHVQAVKRGKDSTTYIPVSPNSEVQGHGSKYQPSNVETGVDPRAFPVVVTMIVTNDEPYQYQERGTVASCLETYQTIVTLR